MNITEQYYLDNSKEFFDSTINADVTPLYDHFLKYILDKGHILDLGCGSGRDTRAFLNKGFTVDAIDGSIFIEDIDTVVIHDIKSGYTNRCPISEVCYPETH